MKKESDFFILQYLYLIESKRGLPEQQLSLI